MDAVLGLSMTPTAVGLVLVEGQDGDGATVDRDAFKVLSRGASDALHTSQQVAAAVMRTEAIAAIRGHRLHSIGVTWSDDAGTEASLVMKSLTESGFDNVVPVRLPDATEALARGIADVVGYDTTAVCVIEPETVIALIVHARDGAVQTVVNHGDASLIGWLSTVFTQADWQPQALVVVGSAGDLDAIMPQLEEALSVPVFAPAEAELALARGAALASAHTAEVGFADTAETVHHVSETRTRGRLAQAGPLVLLGAGAVTFVVSVSLAIGLQLKPANPSGPGGPRPAANTEPAPAAVQPIPPALPPIAIPPAPPADPASKAPTVDAAPASEEAPAEPPTDAGEAPAVSEAPPLTTDSPIVPGPPPMGNEVSGTGAKPPLLTRILGRLPGLHNDPEPVQQDPAQVAPPPTEVPPPVPPVQ